MRLFFAATVVAAGVMQAGAAIAAAPVPLKAPDAAEPLLTWVKGPERDPSRAVRPGRSSESNTPQRVGPETTRDATDGIPQAGRGDGEQPEGASQPASAADEPPVRAAEPGQSAETVPRQTKQPDPPDQPRVAKQHLRKSTPIAISDPPLPRPRPVLAGVAGVSVEQDAAFAIDEALASPGTAFAGTTLEGVNLTPEVIGPMLSEDPLDSEGPRPDYPLRLAAKLTEEGSPLPSGVVWRVFRAQPALDGSFQLVDESRIPRPSFLLPADEYIVHVAYGRADTAKRISLRTGPAREEIALNAGGLRLACLDAMSDDLSNRDISLSIYSSEQDEYGQRRLLVEQAEPDRIIRLNPGTYHVVSRWGDANAVVRADVLVKPGELTDATIHHRAAAITLKLVNEPGGEALANTNWSILSPGGDVVKESFGAFPTHVLAAGEYSVIARHEGKLYNRDFEAVPGLDAEVELVAQ